MDKLRNIGESVQSLLSKMTHFVLCNSRVLPRVFVPGWATSCGKYQSVRSRRMSRRSCLNCAVMMKMERTSKCHMSSTTCHGLPTTRMPRFRSPPSHALVISSSYRVSALLEILAISWNVIGPPGNFSQRTSADASGRKNLAAVKCCLQHCRFLVLVNTYIYWVNRSLWF